MASRFGTPTDGFGSGTEKEFQDAVGQWAERGRPWILFYFHSSPALPQTSKALSQYAKVVKFREKLQRRGIHCQYDSVSVGDNSFLFLVTRHLRELVQRLARETTPEFPTSETTRQSPDPALVIPAGYLAWLQKRYGEMELLGLRLKHGQGVRLNHVYTPLTTAVQSDAQELVAWGQSRATFGTSPVGRQEPILAGEYASRSDRRGDPRPRSGHRD